MALLANDVSKPGSRRLAWTARQFLLAALAMVVTFFWMLSTFEPAAQDDASANPAASASSSPSSPPVVATHTVTVTATQPEPTVTVTGETVTVTAVSADGSGRGGEAAEEPNEQDTAGTGEAADALERLPVKGRAPKTGYSRDAFGQRWADVDRNGCDTRNDILARDLTDVEYRPGTHDCVVLSGTLNDPYTGQVIAFQRGNDTSRAVQIDHVVAMSNAWQTGAQQLDDATRERFANDPLNLLAVDGGANQQKGDGDAATWLPSNKSFRCQYVARQIAVKLRYSLWTTAPEKEAMQRILGGCAGEPLPAG